MNYLTFQIKTSKFPLPNTKSDIKSGPHIIQIAWIISDEKNIIEEYNYVVDTSIEPKVKKLLNLYDNRKRENIQNILENFNKSLQKVDIVMCYNVGFSYNLLELEYIKNEMELRNDCRILDIIEIGTFYLNRELWPSLEELYCNLFGKPLEKFSNIIYECMVCLECFYELKKRYIT